jgi:predicted nucleic acid-binding protein
MILVDTNVFSELQKTQPDATVVDWLHAHKDETLLSTVVIAEIRFGIELTSGERKRRILKGWLDRLIALHAGTRTLNFDTPVAQKYGEIMAALQLDGQHAGIHDGLIAAQAIVHGHRIATRNAKDFRHEGIDLIDPWDT